jgi:hypothetical protein
VEELRMLSNFQAGERALLQSFLIGQPELRAILQGQDMQQFRQRIIASYHLGPLDRTETESYIVHRLKQVGWAGDPTLEPGAFESVYAFTAGIPRRINMVCNRLLLAGFLNEKHVLEAGDVELVAGEIKDELGLAPRNSATAEEPVREAQASWNFRESAAAAYRPRRITQDSLPVDADAGELLPRVVRLEHMLSHVLGALRRVVSVLEPLEKPVKELRP